MIITMYKRRKSVVYFQGDLMKSATRLTCSPILALLKNCKQSLSSLKSEQTDCKADSGGARLTERWRRLMSLWNIHIISSEAVTCATLS